MSLNGDCKVRRVFSGETECAVVFLESTVSQQLLEENVLARLMQLAVRTDSLSLARKSATSGGQITALNSLSECASQLSGGMTLLFIDGVAGCLSVDIRSLPSRSTEEPSLDKTILGARDGFTESVVDNLGLIRKRIRSENLCAKTVFVGSGKAKCFILYMCGQEDGSVLRLEKALKRLDGKLFLTVGDILPVLGPRSIFPTQKITERPDTACSLLSKGRLVLLMDGQPAAVCLPVSLSELFESPNDAAISPPLGKMSKLLRYIGALLCITLPGLYVALLNFHRAVLPAEMTALVIESESLAALPLLPEVLVAWLLVALIFQVGIALPTTVGGTIGIFGSIVLGQALVNANIASELTLLVVITSVVSGYAVPNYPLSTALGPVSLFVLLLSAAFGLPGTGLAVTAVLARILSLTSGSRPFPLAKQRGFITAAELFKSSGAK